jgi:hypothetical protein
MTENLAMSVQELFEEVVQRGITDGVTGNEAYEMLVDEVLEDHLAVAEMHDDQDTEGWADALKARYGEYEVRLEEGG